MLLSMLYGVDVDVKALNIASHLLTLSALTYKRHGVCFPSFLHTSLKPGNALITPLRPEHRGRFAKSWAEQLATLLDLRRRLRDPSLGRDLWVETHRVARAITLEITRAEALAAFKDTFGVLSDAELLSRIERVGLFLYEAEFPEVFFEAAGKNAVRERDNAGFDVVIGNPPWEEPAAEYKQFLPEFDDEYRSLKGAESLAREKELLADPEISSRFEDFSASVEDYKTLLTSGWYEHQVRAVRGRKPGAHTNLYKYATEMACKLLRSSGRSGLVLDGGLWSDLAASGLRRLLLDDNEVDGICGFHNRNRLFEDIDPRQRFAVTAFEKRGRTATLRAVFMQDDFDALECFDAIAVEIPAQQVRSDPRDSYPIPEVRNQEHYRIERLLSNHAVLDGAPWRIELLAEELNAGRHRHFFEVRRTRECVPVVQGQNFHHFGVHFGQPVESWLDLTGPGAEFVLGRERNRLLDKIAEWLEEKGRLPRGPRRDAAAKWLRERQDPKDSVLYGWEGYRLAWRDIARNDDERSLIAAIVPRSVALTDTAPHLRALSLELKETGASWHPQFELPELLYLAGMLSSFTCDAVTRSRLAKTHIKPELLRFLPVPEWRGEPRQRRVAELAARLTCLPQTRARPWADYDELAASVGLNPARDGLVDELQRTGAIVELNAVAAELYGLGAKEFSFLMNMLFMTPEHKTAHAALRDVIVAKLPPIADGGATTARPSPHPVRGPAAQVSRDALDPFSEVGDDWSRPWKIARVLQKLGMDVPDRLRRERVAALVARLGERKLEATLADGSSLDARPPSIEAKVRLRRARRVLFSKYEVVEQVGRPHAGMSEGFKVRDPDGATFFLKIVPVAGALADALRRELDAYTRLQRASGEHLLQVYGSERSEEHLGLLTEFAEGGTLYDYVTARGVLQPSEAKAIARQVCAGLRELELAGVVHRDLKPANVLRAGSAWKLGDFGISKNLTRLVTQGRTFQGYGTPEFAPPEQLAGAQAHSSADVYAFGKLLAFLVTGATDVEKIGDLEWQQLARRCTLTAADTRPPLLGVAEELARL